MNHIKDLVHRRSSLWALQAFIYTTNSQWIGNIQRLAKGVKDPEECIRSLESVSNYGRLIVTIIWLILICRRFPAKEEQLLNLGNTYVLGNTQLTCETLNTIIKNGGLVSWWKIRKESFHSYRNNIFN